MPAADATVDPATLPPICQLRGWVVFGPGFWNGTLYSLADCQRMGRNFDRLSRPSVTVGSPQEPLLEPAGKIGHDQTQQLLRSLGFPRLAGTVTGMTVSPTGLVSIDLDDIPTEFGALLNAKRWTDGSIEIAPPLPDPDDATRELYPVLTGVSFLGDEQPAVPVRYPIPTATFADGRPVPPQYGLTPLAEALAEVSRNFAGAAPAPGGSFSYAGRTYAAAAVCFSAMTPIGKPTMTPEQQAALEAAGFTPEQIAAMTAALGDKMAVTPEPEPAPPAPPAPAPKTMTDPDVPPGDYMSAMKTFSEAADTPESMKQFSKMFAAFAADCAKRFSATEAAVSDMQKDKPEMKAAAAFASEYRTRVEDDHRQRVEAVVAEAILQGRVEARDRAMHVSHGRQQSATRTFAAGNAHAGKSEFDVWKAEILSRRPSRMFSAEIEEPRAGDPGNDPFVRTALATLPGGRELAYTAPVAAK